MRDTPVRRRSPGWVRQWSDATLHAVAVRLGRARLEGDLSARQEWLWDAIVSELEYRWRHNVVSPGKCQCLLCRPPEMLDRD